MTKTQTYQNIYDHAVICGMRHKRGYKGYETLEKASTALSRMCKGTNKEQRNNALLLALKLNSDAEREAIENAKVHRGVHVNDLMASEHWAFAEKKLRLEHPEFSKQAIINSLSWGLYWGVLR